jgi:hypothetical protein
MIKKNEGRIYTCTGCGNEYDRLTAVLLTTKHERHPTKSMESLIGNKRDYISPLWIHSFVCIYCKSWTVTIFGDIIIDWELLKINPWLEKSPLFTHPWHG